MTAAETVARLDHLARQLQQALGDNDWGAAAEIATEIAVIAADAFDEHRASYLAEHRPTGDER